MATALRHLIRLLDDESATVRAAVRAELEKSRKELPDQIATLDRPLTEEEERVMEELLAPSRREDLEDMWMGWQQQRTDEAKLEHALGLLSAFLSGWKARPRQLREQLDRMTVSAISAFDEQTPDVKQLAHWLFGGRAESARLSGNGADYYAPDNSNLLAVLSTGMGNPISLALIYRLIGARMGLKIEGCNFPGHFMARVYYHEQLWLVDCFNRGRFLLADEVARHHPAATPAMVELIHQAAPARVIILRILRNLEDAFDRKDIKEDRALMRKLTARTLQSEE
jgi:regulator of sirC expression with transglutaminase-like and TPR domain